jgi:hypothetical protein
MSRNGSGGIFSNHSPVCLSNRVAFFAFSKALFVNARIGFAVLMPFWAMCFRFLALSVGLSSKCKPILVNPFILIKNFSKRKPLFRSFYYGVRLYSNSFCKLCGFVLLTLYNNKFGISTVQLLLRASRPFTIFWKVAKIVVYSVKRVTFRPFSHVGNEVFKTFSATNRPALTNGYAPASVARELFKVWLFASNNHSMPA